MDKKLQYIFTSKEKYEIAGLLVLIVIGSFFELLGVAVFMPFCDAILDESAVYNKSYLMFFYNIFNFKDYHSFLNGLTFAIILIYVVKNIYLWIEQNLILKFSYNSQMTLSTRLLTAYMKEPYTFHLSKNVAELQRSLQEDTTMFTQMVMHTLQLISEVIVCMVLGIYLFTVSKSITMAVIVLLILCVWLFTTLTKNYSERLGKEAQVYKAKIYQWINQSIGGIKEIKVLGRERYFVDSYGKYYKFYIKGLRINRILSMTPKYLVEAVCMTGMLIAVLLKLNYGNTADLTTFIPQLATFAVAAFRLMPSVGRINEHVNNITYAAPSVELIYHDLKTIEDYEADEEKTVIHNDLTFDNTIEVKNITYSYPDTENAVLDNASCIIPKGKTVALVGTSGAGKTTLADIVLGLLPPDRGHVLVDGVSVYKNLDSWHKHIGYIPQSIYLSDDSIKNNVAFGIDETMIDNDKVEDAIHKAQLSEFVSTLSDGVNTFVGDRGVRLSGGQRQRIGIARALYHDPEILVLDEATSALDTETETAVMQSIERLHGEKTILIIAHRLTTIKNADIVYEVDGGKIVERDKEEVISRA